MAKNNEPRSMQEVAALMRANLPAELTAAEIGKLMGWGQGSDEARARIATLTVEELRQIGLLFEQAVNWALAYGAVERMSPGNPSATGRGALMRHAAKLLAES